MKSSAIVFWVLVSLCVPFTAHSRTWYIKPDGTGDAPTIQAGIDSAAVSDTVLVAAGTYTGAGNKDLTFRGKELVLRSETGPESTVIDCEGSGRGISLLYDAEGPGALIEGFTVTNGWVGENWGGGVALGVTWATLRNCIISGNSAGEGGGIYVGIDATVTNCTISGNSSLGYGGGMYCLYTERTVSDCTISGNSSVGSGGGVFCFAVGSNAQRDPTLLNCTISGNSSGYGGGGLIIKGQPPPDLFWPLVRGCTISGNSSLGYGGPGGGGVLIQSDYGAYVYDCTISGNAASAGRGGGIELLGSSHAAVFQTIIAFSDSGRAVWCDGTSSATLECCDVYGNDGGDWVGCIADDYGIYGNICEDPLFCDPAGGDYHLRYDSPCAPDNSPGGCGLIGALPVGCWGVPISPVTLVILAIALSAIAVWVIRRRGIRMEHQ